MVNGHVIGIVSTSLIELIIAYPKLLALSEGVASKLIKGGIPIQEDGGVVSMLCPTGLDFLVGWIALMRMGYGVVFVA
jgi:acyl-CoA synthetase (AMP-forming)/AMP-acid ligase II